MVICKPQSFDYFTSHFFSDDPRNVTTPAQFALHRTRIDVSCRGPGPTSWRQLTFFYRGASDRSMASCRIWAKCSLWLVGDQGQRLSRVSSPFGRPHCTDLHAWSALEYGPFIDVAPGTGICHLASCRSLSTGYDV